MTDSNPAYHEASHAVAANAHGLGMTHVSIRRKANSLGRCTIQGGNAVNDHRAAIIMIAGHVGERMALGKDPRPNWFLDDDHDTESARIFIAKAWGEAVERQQEGRQMVQLQARSLLFTRWDAVQAVAERLERNTTLVGEEVEQICKRIELRKQGWTEDEILTGLRKLSKAQVLSKLSPKGRRALMGTLAADGKTIIEKATKDRSRTWTNGH